MSKDTNLAINQQQLVAAWQRTLPTVLNPSDHATVFADEANSQAIRLTIKTAGHNGFEFDFICTYLDGREVKVELVDAEKNEWTIDERNERVQQLVEDYIRHIHECAQALYTETRA